VSLIQNLSFWEVVKRQLSFKLKAYHNLIASLFLFQMMALFFSIFGQTTSTSDGFMTITNYIYTADLIVVFTLLWIFTVSFYMTTRGSKNMMFNFITDKRSNHLANFFYMIILSALGAVTAVLLGVLLRLGIVLYNGIDHLFMYESLSIKDLLLMITVVFLYQILLFSFGYLIGEIIQLHKSFVFLVPLLLLGLLIFTVNLFNEAYMFTFYLMEENFLLFSLKVIISVVVFWLLATQVGRRLEVRAI